MNRLLRARRVVVLLLVFSSSGVQRRSGVDAPAQRVNRLERKTALPARGKGHTEANRRAVVYAASGLVVNGTGWASLAAEEFGIKEKVIALSSEVIDTIKQAQWKPIRPAA